MVDSLSCFEVMFYNCCHKDSGVCHFVCEMVHVKDLMLERVAMNWQQQVSSLII